MRAAPEGMFCPGWPRCTKPANSAHDDSSFLAVSRISTSAWKSGSMALTYRSTSLLMVSPSRQDRFAQLQTVGAGVRQVGSE